MMKRRLFFGSLAVLGLLVGFIAYKVYVANRVPKDPVVALSEKDPHFLDQYLSDPAPDRLHFPKQVPPGAENVFVSYEPRFGPKGGHLQLQMTLPRSNVERVYAKFKVQAIHRFKGGNSNDHATAAKGFPTTFYYGTKTGDFPPDFDIWVLGGEVSRSTHSATGSSYGVAVSTIARRVLYWSEWW